MRIVAFSIVFNEENFIWFSLMSVIDYVDKIYVWDTGSADQTVKIIQEIKEKNPQKIIFQEVGKVDSKRMSEMRQKMLESSDCDWFIILDGDEIWPKKAIEELIDLINGKGQDLDGVVAPFYSLIGDIYHYQHESAGRYKFGERVGHLQIKAINRKIKGLHVDNPYPLEGFYNFDKKLVQESQKLGFILNKYFHLSHLKRSSKDRRFDKFKLEIGEPFSSDFEYPEVLNSYPEYIPSPWVRLKGWMLILSRLMTLARKIKRKYEV